MDPFPLFIRECRVTQESWKEPLDSVGRFRYSRASSSATRFWSSCSSPYASLSNSITPFCFLIQTPHDLVTIFSIPSSFFPFPPLKPQDPFRIPAIPCIISYGRLSSPWLEEQRRKGEKCLEIKYIQNKPYVYRSTSVYDKTTKSPKKVSTYLGRLTKEAGLIPKGSRGSRPLPPRTIREYGNAALMTEEFADLLPVLQDAFPACWQELVVLT